MQKPGQPALGILSPAQTCDSELALLLSSCLQLLKLQLFGEEQETEGHPKLR